MEPIHEQAEANKFLEGRIFYPTGHVVTAFDTAEIAARAREALSKRGFPPEHLLSVDAATMAREAADNLDHKSLLSAGASVPTRQKQLQLAEAGCHFLIIYAPDDEDHERVLRALAGLPLKYAVKYHRLIIENLLPGAAMTAIDAEPARVP